jgi:hypothetical protein
VHLPSNKAKPGDVRRDATGTIFSLDNNGKWVRSTLQDKNWPITLSERMNKELAVWPKAKK